MRATAPIAGLAAAMPLVACAADGGGGSSGWGLLIFCGFVAAAYTLVAFVRSASGSNKRGPDEVSADEFVRSTTSIDRPSIER